MKKRILLASFLTFTLILTIVYLSANLIVGDTVAQNQYKDVDWAPDYHYYKVNLDKNVVERSCEFKI